MPRYPEAQALLEQALSHALLEQEALLKRDDRDELSEAVTALNGLALQTMNLLREGLDANSVASLVKKGKEIESSVDDISESLWTFIPVSVSAIYERIEKSLKTKGGKQGLIADTRSYYHNLRIKLLNQMLGAQMLISSADRGEERERLWQQFLQRHLGSDFKVVRGGHVYDHEGNRSDCQVDLMVVPADAHVFVPGDSEGGKASVLIDQLISVIMVASNLTVPKMKEDWQKIQSLPQYSEMEADFPRLKGHPWPLCYFLAGQSDSAETLKNSWEELARSGLTQVVPQFVIALETGFLYCGLRRWPAPHFPGNYTQSDEVHIEDGILGGLGLAWLITQHQGRLAVIQGRPLGAINRFAKLLDDAQLREGVSPTYSQRFQTHFQMGPITGMLAWGASACFVHNRLQLSSLQRNPGEGKTLLEKELFQEGTDFTTMEHRTHQNFLRWFRYGITHAAGNLLALEEWINPRSKSEHRRRIAVFDVVSGNEIKGPHINAFRDVSDLGNPPLS